MSGTRRCRRQNLWYKVKKRIEALTLATALVVTSFTGYGRLTDKVYAEEPDTVIFAQGAGTGKDFSSSLWKFAGQAQDGAGSLYTISGENLPGIVKNNYSKNAENPENVIRLIKGVKVGDAEGNEATDSYKDYRSGEAFLSDGIKLNSSAEFSMKFTFSMPDACVNTGQTGGEEYAREVGGDGIAFLMTTNPTHDTRAGSGMGYAGIDNSMAIELDSFFNGAYCDTKAPAVGTGTAYANWGFDNQIYFHKNWNYNNTTTYPNPANPYGTGTDRDYAGYRNYKFNERFDHVGITLDGQVTKHEAIDYINGLDPTETEKKTGSSGDYYEFKNLAYFNACAGGVLDNTTALEAALNGPTNTESTSSTCATRFADKNVNDRLFTVWVDYDGAKMYVRYANGDFKNAVRPETAQIERTVNMDKFNGKTVYMGFTSAVGSSKANHTIHSFQFTNEFKPIDGKASYKVEYYLQDENDPDNYILQDRDTVTEDNATAEDVVNYTDNGYKKTYEGYDYTTVDGKSISRITVAADGSSVLKLYYNLKDKATYKLNYWLKNKTTGEYEKKDSSSVKEGYVGTDVTASDVDGTYPTKYVDSNYALSSVKPQNDKATLAQKDTLYEMDVYYDPVEASYQLHYWKYNPETGKYKEDADAASAVKNGAVGDTYTATDVDPGYKTKYASEHYALSTKKTQEDSVELKKANTKV